METEELILKAKTTYYNNVETEYLLWQIAIRLEELHNRLKEADIRSSQ